MSEEVKEQLGNPYAAALESAFDDKYESSVDQWGDETISERSSESVEAAVVETIAAPTGGAEEQVSENQEPATVQFTFDAEVDRHNGIDVDAPTYRAAQEALARTPSTLATEDESSDASDAERSSEVATEPEDDYTVPDMKVSFDDFEVTRLEADHPLAGMEDSIGEIVKDYVRAAVSQVNRQNQEFASEQKLKNTTRFLEDAVGELKRGWGEEYQTKALKIMKEYPDMARQSPRKFLRLAINLLGIDPSDPPLLKKAVESEAKPAPTAKPGPDPKRIAHQVVSQQTRPATPTASAPGRPKQFASIKDAVRDALDRELTR